MQLLFRVKGLKGVGLYLIIPLVLVRGSAKSLQMEKEGPVQRNAHSVRRAEFYESEPAICQVASTQRLRVTFPSSCMAAPNPKTLNPA